MEAAATSNLKQVCLELGGKSPFIVFDDVDVHKIAPLALNACLFNQARYSLSHFSFSFLFIQMCFPIVQILSYQNIFQGQICVAGTRIFVQEGIYDKFVARLVEELKTWVVGDPFDPNVNQGPQV